MADENVSASGTSSASSGSPAGSTGSSSTPSSASSTGSSGSAAPSSTPASAAASLERVSAALSGSGSSPDPTGTPSGSGASPAPSTTPASGGAGAPGTETPVGGGPVPLERHQAAVRNARTKVLEELGIPADTPLPAAELKRRFAVVTQLFNNPQAFYQQLGQELGISAADPQTPMSAAPEWQDPEDPEPDLRDMAGNPAGYSPKLLKQLIANAVARVTRQWEEQFAPVAETVTGFQTEREQLQIQQQASQTAASVLGELRANPEFKKHEKQVLEVYRNLVAAGVMEQYGPVATLHMAWNKFFHESVVPTLGQQTQQQAISEMQRAANAGAVGAVTPTTPAVAKPRLREGNVTDLAEHMARLAGAQSTT